MKATMSNCRDSEDRSKKSCCCGGHNSSNVKSNLQHNGTKCKKQRREERKLKKILSENMDP